MQNDAPDIIGRYMTRSAPEAAPETRDETDILVRSADFKPQSWDEATRTIEIVASSGAAVRRYDWELGRYFMESLEISERAIDAGRLKEGRVPLLVDHSRYGNALGRIINHRIEGGLLIVNAILSDAEQHKDTVRNILTGIHTSVSVGYKIHEFRQEERNGTLHVVATRWEPLEVSDVRIPADPAAHIRSEPTAPATPPGPDASAVRSDPPVTIPQTKPESRTRMDPEELKAALEAERQRGIEIREMADTHNLGADFAARHIASGATVDTVRAAAMTVLAERSKADAPAVSTATTTIVRDESENIFKRAEVAVSGFMTGKPVRDEDVGEFRGMGPMRIAREMIGSAARGMSDDELITHICRTGGAIGSSDYMFTTAIAQGINARIRDRQSTLQIDLAELVKVTLVDNHLPTETFSAGGYPPFKEIPEGGSYEFGTSSEESTLIKISKAGSLYVLTEEAIRNDKWGLFQSQIDNSVTQGVVFRNEKIAAALGANLKDGKPAFHVSRGNVITDAFSPEAMAKARTKLRDITDIAGTKMNLEAQFLVVAPDLEEQALRITSAVNATTIDGVNTFAGKLKPIVYGRLKPGEWMMWANPNFGDFIEMVDLRGQEGVRLSTPYPEWKNDALVYKARTFAGAAMSGHRAGIKSTGTGA